jgi:simple sugar transport system ATP-binding protein
MVALDNVDFSLRAGEIHALMGENGAGKSTLIKVMTGALPCEGGEIVLEGQEIKPRSTFEAANLGIRPVYQEVNLAPNLSVAENICLGQFHFQRVGLGWKQMVVQAENAVEKLALHIDVRRPLSDFSVAIQQMVAIARAMAVTPKVLVLDEPTSSLDSAEVEQVFTVMRRLRDNGLGIVFVSHFLDQVFAVSDRITVLRNGKLIAVDTAAAMGPKTLVRHMIGRGETEGERTRQTPSIQPPSGKSLIKAIGIGKRSTISDVDVSVSPGEVIGLAGLLGSGRTETLRLLFGEDHCDSGRLEVNGKQVSRWNCRRAIQSGFGFCTEDRKVSGIVPELSVRENILIALQARRNLFAPLSLKQQRETANRMVKLLNIATTDVDKPIQFLSGGNQQKCLLARWLVTEPTLLLLDEPTRGIDVGAKQEILDLIEDLRAKGMGLIIADSELRELLRVATGVVVLRDRKLIQYLGASEAHEDAILSMMAEGSA